MKKSALFLLIGIVMLVAGIIFIAYAITHPEQSFPWSNTITYVLYAVYLLITVVMFVLSGKCRK